MNLYREDILDTKEELDKAREKLIEEQRNTARILFSIDLNCFLENYVTVSMMV